MEIMEPPVDTIRYPQMRAEVLEAVRALSDPDYQQRVWIRGEYPHEGFYDDLTTNIHTLFDDVCVLPDPHTRVGVVLYPDEVEALTGLGQHLDPLINELGDAADAHYLEHPQWTSVVAAARRSYETLRRNDTT